MKLLYTVNKVNQKIYLMLKFNLYFQIMKNMKSYYNLRLILILDLMPKKF